MFLKNVFLILQIIYAYAYVPKDSVKFLFYKINTDPVEIKNKNFHDLNINVQTPVKILCHGLATNSSVNWYKAIMKPYIEMNYTVLAVDWASYAFSGYLKAISASEEIGSLIGKFIIDLTNTLGMNLNEVHVIGHSLGAHIGGFSGKFVFDNTKQKIGRITGLDPAGPLHNYVSKDKRLCDDDAVLVDIIHTNAGELGISPSIGHMDFYPDGGINQKRCNLLESECNHNMAPTYFAESIGCNNFEAILCDSYNNYALGQCNNNTKAFMGDSCQFRIKGDYFLTTYVP